MPWHVDPDNPQLTYDEIDAYIADWNELQKARQRQAREAAAKNRRR